MANSNFVVQNGITVGPWTVDASTGNASTSGSVRSDKIIVQTVTGNYTLVSSDSGTTIVVNSGSAVIITVPAGLPIGFRCLVVRLGAGTVTLAQSGLTAFLSRTSAASITAQYGSASVFFYNTNSVILDGSI